MKENGSLKDLLFGHHKNQNSLQKPLAFTKAQPKFMSKASSYHNLHNLSLRSLKNNPNKPFCSESRDREATPTYKYDPYLSKMYPQTENNVLKEKQINVEVSAFDPFIKPLPSNSHRPAEGLKKAMVEQCKRIIGQQQKQTNKILSIEGNSEFSLYSKYLPYSSKQIHFNQPLPLEQIIRTPRIIQTPRIIDTPRTVEMHSQVTRNEAKRPKLLTRPRNLAQQFVICKLLGKGRFGSVYRVRHLATGAIFAMKQVAIERASAKLIQRLTDEIKIQSHVHHENCLQLYKVYRDNSKLMLILELGEESLFDQLRQKKYFSEREACNVVVQVIEALKHLHLEGIIHRDLKPENIIIVQGVAKIADFGWSVYVGKDNKRSTFCGTLDYVSPQIVMGQLYDASVDVWSVGVLCYELCTGHAPFESLRSKEETYKKILNVQVKFPKYLSNEVRNFISRLLERTPKERMTLSNALLHPWVKNNIK